MILAVINLSLTIWIMRVMDFNQDGMGKLTITDTGLRLYGHAEFVESLQAKEIRSNHNKPLVVQSTKSLVLNARDGNGNITGQLYLDGDQVVVKNKYLWIKTDQDKKILYADKDKIEFYSDKLQFSSPYGAHFTGSIETQKVMSPPRQHLTLESLTQSLHMNAPNGINMKTTAGGMVLDSLTDISMKTTKKITLDADSIFLKFGSGSSNRCTVCIDKNNKLFLGASDGCNKQC
ncbi:hypothetical protein QZH41_012615 [Actinostola sp. cb2023]|nr:hypothetical protein QZH41_012615 [Actinostola sp. cb2023]